MKLHRFIGEFDFSQNEIEILNPEIIKQIKGVLRLEIGEALVLSDGQGLQYKVKITSLSQQKIICEKIEEIESNEPEKKVSLYLAILKKENFELAVQKAVETGASEIIPIITERTIKTGLNMDRLNKIIREASEQSERGIVPKLSPIMDFKDAILDGKKNMEKLFFDTGSQEKKHKGETFAKSASIFIGPEGGFTETENTLAKENDYTIESLGENTLRAETAAIVATYKVVNNL
jgi:16S rRNA (uracil1498-N3)-methyltransferase